MWYQKTKEELITKERFYIQNNECINKIIPSMTGRNTKINCICGGKYTHKHKSTHLKNNKHQKILENNNWIKIFL